MTTIPDDEMRVARAILKARYYDYEPDAYGSVEEFFDILYAEQMYEAVQEAKAAIEAMQPSILAERERCANIAEQKFNIDTVRKNADGKPYQTGSAAIYAAGRIAAAIRKGSD